MVDGSGVEGERAAMAAQMAAGDGGGWFHHSECVNVDDDG
jgi:hypothetical protein